MSGNHQTLVNFLLMFTVIKTEPRIIADVLAFLGWKHFHELIYACINHSSDWRKNQCACIPVSFSGFNIKIRALKLGRPRYFPHFNLTECQWVTSCDQRGPVQTITHVLLLQGSGCCMCQIAEAAFPHAGIYYCKIQSDETKSKSEDKSNQTFENHHGQSLSSVWPRQLEIK